MVTAKLDVETNVDFLCSPLSALILLTVNSAEFPKVNASIGMNLDCSIKNMQSIEDIKLNIESFVTIAPRESPGFPLSTVGSMYAELNTAVTIRLVLSAIAYIEKSAAPNLRASVMEKINSDSDDSP